MSQVLRNGKMVACSAADLARWDAEVSAGRAMSREDAAAGERGPAPRSRRASGGDAAAGERGPAGESASSDTSTAASAAGKG